MGCLKQFSVGGIAPTTPRIRPAARPMASVGASSTRPNAPMGILTATPSRRISATAEASNAPNWIIASILVPVLLLRCRIEMKRGHWIVLALLGWTAFSLLWATSVFDGLNQLWKYMVLAGAFALGSCVDIRPALKWFILGIAVNVSVAVAQEFGLWVSLSAAGNAGLLLQKNYLAESGLLALMAAFVLGSRILAVPSLLAWTLPFSKSALFAGGLVATHWVWKRHRLAGAFLGLLVVVGSVAAVGHFVKQSGFWDRSPGARVAMAANTASAIVGRPLGHGVGSYWSAYPVYHDRIMPTGPGAYRVTVRPRTAHSDILTVGFELGFPGLFLLAWLGFLMRGHEYSRIVLAFAALGAFAFPLFVPSTALIVALVAGRICGDGHTVRRIYDRRRGDVQARQRND